jgi:hypothetical protein
MADLTGTTPADTYKSLLQIGDATNGVDATAKYIEDGEGTDSALAISTDKVGIGTDSPDALLHIVKSNDSSVGINIDNGNAGTTAHARLALKNNSDDTFYLLNNGSGRTLTRYGITVADYSEILAQESINGLLIGTGLTNTPIIFGNNNTERMRIDSDGNVGIGTDSPDEELHIEGADAPYIKVEASDNTDSGMVLAKQSVNKWFILNDADQSDNFSIRGDGGGTDEFLTIKQDGNVTPGTDDAQDFGSASKRWDDIYATNTTIQTSDRELKQDIEELTEAEERVAVACKGLLRKYRWKSSVEEKGDDARIHFGIMAQDLEAAFAAEGLDAGRYGMFIKNTWWEADRVIPAVEAVEAVEAVYDEEGNEVSPAVEAVEAQPERTERDIFDNIEDAPEGATEVTQRGVRYAELLAFIIAAI